MQFYTLVDACEEGVSVLPVSRLLSGADSGLRFLC